MKPDIVRTYPFIDRWRATGFQYFVLPKAMLTAGRQLNLSSDEAMLYMILRDRTTLSYKNRWVDELGRVYIIFRREDAAKYLGWSQRKTIDVFANLVAAGLLVEVAQKNNSKSKLKKPKKLYVKQWGEPSILMSAQDIKAGGLPYLTEENILADVGAYYIIPRVLFEDEVFTGLTLRAILLYAIALDAMQLSLAYGRVDKNNLVWCDLDSAVLKDHIACSKASLSRAWGELEEIGLISRHLGCGIDGRARIYVRDYLPPPADVSAQPQTPDGYAPPGAEMELPGEASILHLGELKFAPANPQDCIRSAQKMHPGGIDFASDEGQPLHPSYPCSSTPSTHPSLASLAGGPEIGALAEAPGFEKEVFDIDAVHARLRAAVEYNELLVDIQLASPEEEHVLRKELLDQCLDIAVEDISAKATKIRLGDQLVDKQLLEEAYDGLNRYILYTMLDKIIPRLSDIKNVKAYLRRSLLGAALNFSGEAYYTKLKIEKARANADVLSGQRESMNELQNLLARLKQEDI